MVVACSVCTLAEGIATLSPYGNNAGALGGVLETPEFPTVRSEMSPQAPHSPQLLR